MGLTKYAHISPVKLITVSLNYGECEISLSEIVVSDLTPSTNLIVSIDKGLEISR